MITNRLTSRWTVEKAQVITGFLDELQESLWANYKEELMEYYCCQEHEQEQDNERQLTMEFDDEIPF